MNQSEKMTDEEFQALLKKKDREFFEGFLKDSNIKNTYEYIEQEIFGEEALQIIIQSMRVLDSIMTVFGPQFSALLMIELGRLVGRLEDAEED